MRRAVALSAVMMVLAAGCSSVGASAAGPQTSTPEQMPPSTRRDPPIRVGEVVVANPRRITGVDPCSVVRPEEVRRWVGSGSPVRDDVLCELDGSQGKVQVYLGIRENLLSASQVAINDLGYRDTLRRNTAWVNPDPPAGCRVYVAVSSSRSVPALYVRADPDRDCGLAREVAETVFDRLPPGPDPEEQYDLNLHPTSPTVAAPPTR